MIGAVGASTNLYTPKSKSKASVPMEKTEAMKGTCQADTKKQIEALKKEIADRLNEMNIADKVSELKVHMSDAYLEACLKDPQTLENAMKSLEDAAAENMKEMLEKLSEDLMYRNLKTWANDESLN